MKMANMRMYLLTLCIYIVIEIASSADEGETYRLSDNHIPKSYDLKLTHNPDNNAFSGKVTIKFTTENETDHVLLHASPSRITNITKLMLNSAHVCTYSSNSKTEILNITCPRPIKKGVNKLLIHFKGLYGINGLKNQFYGVFRSSFETAEGLQNGIATQFQTTYARMAFPCFDEPRFKAVFQITLIHPQRYNALTNTKMSSEKNHEGTVETQFEKTPPISTYVLAFVVSNLIGSSDNTSTPVITVYSRPSQNENKKTALSYTRDIVEALGNWTAIKYEHLGISKLDIVATPQFTSEAMENWGLIIFDETNLLDEGNKTSAEDKRNILCLIAHELAHHWFGNYVTLDWWSNTWLNEGFATYLQYIIPDMVKSLNMKLKRQIIPLTVQSALDLDDSAMSPLSSSYKDIETQEDIEDKFDLISYDKGATIVRMMSSILGEENFRKGLQSYLKLNAHKNTNPTDLLEALGEFYEDNTNTFADLMKNWIYQAGYPIVTVSLNEAKNVVIIHQNEFSSNVDSEKEKIWKIPITFATSTNKHFNIKDIQWVTDKKPLTIPFENCSWIILNLQQMGYYRVNYDEELWNRIILVLKSNEMKQIHVSNRAQLIDDAFSLAKIDKLDFKLVLELARYLEKESEYEPWYAAAKSLKYIKRLLEAYGDKDDLQKLRELVLPWVNRAFPVDRGMYLTDHLEILTHQVIYDLKCHMDEDKCLESSRKILKKFKNYKIVDDHNTRQTALCIGLKVSKTPKEDYRTLLTFYNQSDSAIERRTILRSLGCISDTDVLTEYLSELLSDNTLISKPDITNVYIGIVSNIQGLNTALSFLTDHLKEIYERHSGVLGIADLILQPADWIVTEQQSKQMKNIMEKYKDIEGMDRIELFSSKNHTTIRKRIKSVLKNITI